jgi:hypothetical protein
VEQRVSTLMSPAARLSAFMVLLLSLLLYSLCPKSAWLLPSSSEDAAA